MVTTDRISALPSATSSFYRPELDGLRFFACLAMFVHHVGVTVPLSFTAASSVRVQQAGACGVCLFFLLSAYLITLPLPRYG